MNKSLYILSISVALISGCGKNNFFANNEENLAKYRTTPITKTDIVRTVEATGTVTPRNSSNGIPVGAQVNGKLIKLFVDYNSIVTNGQVVALIDPLVYEANYKSAVARQKVNEANVDVATANLASREAELVMAEKTYARKKGLVEKAMAPVADLDSATESLAKAKAAVESAKATLKSAKASVMQSEADVSQAKANLEYCTIVSPVNGVVIDRKVEEGETVVSSMNAVPVLTIAEDLKVIWIEATIPEADVGNIKVGQQVVFTADAYRRKFKGTVKQIRRAATETNNVVTFPVIIEAENPDEMLFPGMTVTLSVETARVSDVPSVGTAALRFRPKKEDLAHLEGKIPRGKKLWFASDDGKVYPVVVKEGVSDDIHVQVDAVDGSSLEGKDAIIGYELTGNEKTAASDRAKNPFMPKVPNRNSNKGTAPEQRTK
jgi:HlyD family secretion protein